MGSYTDSLEGLAAIRRDKPELVLLDIEMPKMNGFELLEHCHPVPFRVIFTTAYNQYAVRAFKYSALDYLLKPLTEEDVKYLTYCRIQYNEENDCLYTFT